MSRRCAKEKQSKDKSAKNSMRPESLDTGQLPEGPNSSDFTFGLLLSLRHFQPKGIQDVLV
jgi:hypothetical protein